MHFEMKRRAECEVWAEAYVANCIYGKRGGGKMEEVWCTSVMYDACVCVQHCMHGYICVSFNFYFNEGMFSCKDAGKREKRTVCHPYFLTG